MARPHPHFAGQRFLNGAILAGGAGAWRKPLDKARGCVGVHFGDNGFMPRISVHRRMLKLGMALFLTGQVVAVAHAAEHGPDPHEHGGIVCSAILNDEQEGIVPIACLTASPVIASVFDGPRSARQAPPERPRSVRPPPTGPPSIHKTL